MFPAAVIPRLCCLHPSRSGPNLTLATCHRRGATGGGVKIAVHGGVAAQQQQ